MKYFKTFLIILLILNFITLIFDHNKYKINVNTINGIWVGSLKNGLINYEFNFDNTCIIEIIRNNSDEIIILSGQYEIDLTKNPIPLSIRNVSQLNHPLYTIIQFINYETIMIGSYGVRWRLRPISFDYKNSIILKRKMEL